MPKSLQIYKNNINNKIQHLQENYSIKFIYGGATEHNPEVRISQHIDDDEPKECDDAWDYITATKYELTGDLNVDKCNISEIENYLINTLNNVFGYNCVNSRNRYGSIVQIGGNGINITNNNVGDKIKFYIFFKIINPQIDPMQMFI